VFLTAGRTCLEQGDSAQVLSILVDEKNKVRWTASSALCGSSMEKDKFKNVFPCFTQVHSEMHGLESAGTSGTDAPEEGGQKPSPLPCHPVASAGGLVLKP